LTGGIDVQLWVTLDGGKVLKYRLVQHASYFALNEMPQATCLLAVGKPVPGDKLDPFNSTAGQLKAMQKALVVGKFSGDYDAAGTQWPGATSTTKKTAANTSIAQTSGDASAANYLGYQVLFDGKLVGFNYQKIDGRIFVVVQLIHWLVDLANTSLLSQYVHPSGAANLAFPLSRLAPGTGDAATQPFLVSDVGPDLLDLPQLTQDVWGALKDFFYVYAGSRPMDFGGDFSTNLVANSAVNNLAKNALGRMEGGLGMTAETRKALFPYNFGKPGSPLQTSSPSGDEAVAGAIRSSIMKQINQVYGAGTLWDHLVGEISPNFDLHVVPMIDRALVVPLTPGLSFTGNQTPWRTLAVDDYFAENMQAALHYPIKAVVVANNRGRSSTDANITKVSFNGLFQPLDIPDAANGAIVFLQAPEWIQEIEPSAARNSAPPGVQVGAVVNAAENPQKPANANNAAQAGVDLAKTQFNYLNRFAQSMYVQRALAGRVGTIASRLRFDIAPGSTIKLMGSSELFLSKNQDALAQDVYGLVVRSSILIDADSQQAATTYQLSHLRSLSETQSGYCQASNPLYNTRFVGTPMLPAFNIGNI
jgi:hypothetical protein